MKLTYKILSIIGLIGTLTFVFFLGAVPLVEGRHIIKPYIDTRFSENYSPEKFEEIETGMTKNQVEYLIGRPLRIGKGYDDSLVTNYHYTGDGKLLNLRKPVEQHYDDFAWYRSTVGFDTNNIVVFIYKGWSYD